MYAWALAKMIALLGPIAEMQKDKRELADQALRAVSDALTKTRLYCKSLDDGIVPERKKEEELMKAWANAAIPMRHIDREFSEICEHKSQFWLNPAEWPQGSVAEMGIDLESVRERYQTLLKSK